MIVMYKKHNRIDLKETISKIKLEELALAKQNNTPAHQQKYWAPFSKFQPFTVEVKCIKGAKHKISLTSSGKLIIHDHTKAEFEAILAFKALGANTLCKCLSVYKHWLGCCRRSRYGAPHLPDELNSESIRACSRNKRRRARQKIMSKDYLTVPLMQRPQIIKHLIKRSFERYTASLGPKVIKQKSKIPLRLFGTKTDHLIVELPVETGKTSAGRGHTVYSLKLNNTEWYEEVYLKGLAIVDDMFITEVDWQKKDRSIQRGTTDTQYYDYKAGKYKILESDMYIVQGVHISSNSIYPSNTPITARMYVCHKVLLKYDYNHGKHKLIQIMY